MNEKNWKIDFNQNHDHSPLRSFYTRVVSKLRRLRTVIKICSLLFRHTTEFWSLTLSNRTPNFKSVHNIVLEKQHNLYQRVCQSVQCVPSKVANLYVFVNPFTTSTITSMFNFQKCLELIFSLNMYPYRTFTFHFFLFLNSP